MRRIVIHAAEILARTFDSGNADRAIEKNVTSATRNICGSVATGEHRLPDAGICSL